MSLITQCPQCGTTFKVVQDQLRISDGWVRCGHCTEVFDSTPNLRELDLATVIASPASDPAKPERDTVLPVVEVQPGIATELSGSAEAQRPLDESMEAFMGAPDIALDDVKDALAGEHAPDPAVPLRSLAESVDHMHSLLSGQAGQDVLTNATAEPLEPVSEGTLSQPAPLGADFSFVVAAKSPLAPVSRGARWVFAVASLLLLLALGMQVVLHERERLAATHPSWRSALQGLCGIAHCTLHPWRDIEAISVDASSFNKLRGDTYRLGFSLKNAASLDLAFPAIELTLTDSQDTPLLRRVLLPANLEPPWAVLPAGGEWSGGALVAVAGDPAGAALARRISGYRILAFYP